MGFSLSWGFRLGQPDFAVLMAQIRQDDGQRPALIKALKAKGL